MCSLRQPLYSGSHSRLGLQPSLNSFIVIFYIDNFFSFDESSVFVLLIVNQRDLFTDNLID